MICSTVLRLAALALLAAACLGAAPARASRPPQKWAVLIGINTYQNKGVSTLDYAEADARALAEALRTAGGVPAENIFLFTSDKTGDEAPTRTNIAFRFDYLARTMQPQDTLLVFFSGHGVELEGQSFLLTVEADPRSLLTLQQSALQARDLFGWVQATRASKVLLLVDACRNDPYKGRGQGDNRLGQNLARDLTLVNTAGPGTSPSLPSYATLFACSAGQRSYEWNDKGHGFFTYFLIEGLKGQAAEPGGQVTLASLVRYVQRQVSEASSRWTMNQQVPWLRYEGPGADGWVLASGAPGAAPGADPRLLEAEARAREAEERARQAEARARQAEQARQEAEARLREAEEAQRQAQANPQNPDLAEQARQALARAQAAEQARQEAEGGSGSQPATRGDLAARIASLEQSLGLSSSSAPSTPTAVLFVSPQEGAPYKTIQAALEAAPAGARILVLPGTYRESLRIGKPVQIEGYGPVDQVILEADAGPVITVVNNAAVSLEGLTLRCPQAGSQAVAGPASLRNCRLVEPPPPERVEKPVYARPRHSFSLRCR